MAANPKSEVNEGQIVGRAEGHKEGQVQEQSNANAGNTSHLGQAFSAVARKFEANESNPNKEQPKVESKTEVKLTEVKSTNEGDSSKNTVVTSIPRRLTKFVFKPIHFKGDTPFQLKKRECWFNYEEGLDKKVKAEVQILDKDENQLVADFVSPRFHFTSARTKQHYEDLVKLYGDINVMGTLGTGDTVGAEGVIFRMKNWGNRLCNEYPFTGVIVYERTTQHQKTPQCIGLIAIAPGTAAVKEGPMARAGQLSYIFHAFCHNKNHNKVADKPQYEYVATECVDAMVNGLGPYLTQFQLYKGDKDNERPFEAIFATASPENPGSYLAMENAGMERMNRGKNEEIVMEEFTKKSGEKVKLPRYTYYTKVGKMGT